MRRNLAFSRRVSLTGARGLLAFLLVAALVALVPGHASATPGKDDYPSRLKRAAKDSLVDPWRFYNRECTSFVAWRLTNDNGIPFDDYWGTHWGNASNWKAAADKLGFKTDNHPVVGAVAWWSAHSVGSSVGHVAWVETVNPTSITIEEYNYLHSGEYDTRTISTDSSYWPGAFLHLHDLAMSNTAPPPSPSGTPKVGVTLRGHNGHWSPTDASFTYQWLAAGAAVPGATAKSFTPTASVLGKRLRLRVTATKPGFKPVTALSARTTKVASGVFDETEAPTMTGTAQIGKVLTIDPGTWSPAGVASIQWLVDGTPVPGATTATFAPRPVDVGKTVSATITVQQAGYRDGTATVTAPAPVAQGRFVRNERPAISGLAKVDQLLTTTPGVWDPAGTYTYQWKADGVAIAGAAQPSFHPGPDEVGKVLTVQVTVSTPGYKSDSSTSQPTAAVVPGTFTNTTKPALTGTARVGVPLSASEGRWTPAGTASYAWYADGKRIDGATGHTFVPTADQLGKRIAVEVSVARPGYTVGHATSDATAAVAPGVMTNVHRPDLSAGRVVGQTLTASTGSWSVTPDRYDYQWLADGAPIAGADRPTLTLTRALVDERIAVRVTAHVPGYTPVSAASRTTPPVVLGIAQVQTPPTVRGQVVLGKVLRVVPGTWTPRSANPTYQWFRGSHAISGATGTTYRLRKIDVRHRISVRMSVAPPHWAATSARSASTDKVVSVPRVVATATPHGRSFSLVVRVHAPGVATPRGTVTVLRGQRVLDELRVHQGRASGTIGPLRAGRHHLTVEYADDPRVHPARIHFVVRLR